MIYVTQFKSYTGTVVQYKTNNKEQWEADMEFCIERGCKELTQFIESFY